MANPTVHKKECRELTLEKVVVFNDMAELKRKMLCELHPGINEVRLENVTDHLINDSVRVDGRGDGVIHDVQLSEKAVVPEETDSTKVAEKRARYEEKLEQVNVLKDRVSVAQRIVNILDKMMEGVGNNVVCPPKDSKELFLPNKKTLEDLKNFCSFYGESSTSARSELRDLKKTLEKTERELNILDDVLNNAKSDRSAMRFNRSIVTTLESKAGGTVELEVSYQVHDASVYFSTSQVIYFGNVSQSTGEDWNIATLVLSTAQPCLGGHIPKLAVLEAVFHRPPPPPRAPFTMPFGSIAGNTTVRPASTFSTQQRAFDREFPEMERAVTYAPKPAEHALRTEFTIAKPTAIPSDGTEHKVTIGVVDVSPQLIHECVPKKNTSTFLTACALNSSSLPFLSGCAAVFLNNSFVAKTNMNSISPGEKFSCSLGVDTALRVEYKPIKKYHEEVGLVSKSSSDVHEQVIIVRNSRPHDVLLTIKEQIPRSTDEKIKVRIISPVVSQLDEGGANGEGDITVAEMPKEGCRLRDGILEWTISLQGGKSAELLVKWALDYPKDQVVEFMERY